MAVTRIDTSALVDQSSFGKYQVWIFLLCFVADPPTAIAFPPWSGKDRRHRTGGRVERLARRDDARHQFPEKSAQ
jgi:hypothetical protein